MFHRVGPAAYKPNLDNTLALAAAAGNPELGLQSIHIAGTNGKGSTSHMLASILQEAGYTTGLYTSPHLKDFRERIKVNGTMVSEDWICDYVSRNKGVFDRLRPSFFEMSTVMAFSYFRDRQCAINVIETGLGGRLDSTNIIKPLLAVITNIGWDHMHLLGDTLQQIAFEKAGIIKAGTPVVIGEMQQETTKTFEEKSGAERAELHFADQHFSAKVLQHDLLADQMLLNIFKNGQPYLHEISCDLTGTYQLKNILTVLQSVDLIRKQLRITDEHIRKGLSSVKSNTGLQGRWQVLSRQPLVICDTGHNEQGLIEVMDMLRHLHYKHLHFVVGVVEDKDLHKMLLLLPKDATYYFCKANIPRGLSAALLKEAALAAGLQGAAYDSVGEALAAAKEIAGNGELIFVGGSTFTVAEVL